ncbi:Elongation of very long chain fatty acids protein 4 [Lucilia cuprina]|nr:Elongation of very long chain fatty acids protein 4 [Lucilia cuprina]
MLLLKMICNALIAINEVFENDKRLSSYPFLGKPWPMLAVVSIYLLAVLKWGPKFMANRNPYKVDGIMKLYNVVQIALNGYIFYEALKYSYLRDDFVMNCQKHDPTDTRPLTMKLARPALLYYFSKYLDLLDTFFFIVRKKNNQITFLHVYHHSLMIMGVYIYCRFLFYPRVQHLPLVFSPMPVIVILSLYLAFVLHYGPKWMEKRQAFQLKLIMRIYNAVQVLANLTLFICAIPNSYGHKKFSFTCQPVDPTNTEPWMIRLLYITYGYYLTKYLDLFDTIFIVLRKKNQQISFLHIYHHTGMVFGCYIYMTFLPGSHATMLGLINLFVHTVMYSYYFVTSLKPIKETLWWKRHITQLQLAQFGYLFIHFLIVLVRNTCGHPNVVALVGFMQNMFMFALFFEFYYKAYVKKPKATAANNTVTRDNTNQLSKEEKLKSS